MAMRVLPVVRNDCAGVHRALVSHTEETKTEEKMPAHGAILKLHEPSADMRPNGTFSQRSLYGSWSQNLLHDPPHASGTSDAADVAAGNHQTCRGSPAGPGARAPGWGGE